ncbi:MAG: ABC transporter ATP-binding protein [Opitutales bacterium]|nr:ABC transporter ATP-binding protein [Opitutales bacterium]
MNSLPYPIQVHDLTVSYQRKPVLYGVDLEIEAGSLVGVIGPNGAGKSTLIKTIMNMVRPNGGFVKILGKSPKAGTKHIGYVPQRESVDWEFPVTVMDVVLMGRYGHLGWFGRISKADKKMAHECLEKVDMLSYANRQIGNLSGGQQQRVFLARALAQESSIYLMDEPFVGVDAVTEKTIVSILKSMQQSGKTLVIVHHDLATAKNYFDHLLLLNMRKIAYGPTPKVFTEELLQKTYGGRLTVFSEMASQAAKQPEIETAKTIGE